MLVGVHWQAPITDMGWPSGLHLAKYLDSSVSNYLNPYCAPVGNPFTQNRRSKLKKEQRNHEDTQ
jgi:hypothetical protein